MHDVFYQYNLIAVLKPGFVIKVSHADETFEMILRSICRYTEFTLIEFHLLFESLRNY